MRELVDKVMYTTRDPKNLIRGQPVPAVTTLLYKICDNDEERFDEALRLIELFIEKALETKPS